MIREILSAKSIDTYSKTKPYSQAAKTAEKTNEPDSFRKTEPSLIPDVYDKVQVMDAAKAAKMFSKENNDNAADIFGQMVAAAAGQYVKSAKVFEEVLKIDSNPEMTNRILSSNNSAFEEICKKYS